jgi:hypothetical protein
MTSDPDGFHPDLADPGPLTRVHLVRGDELDGSTGQTAGMRRFAAISGDRVGSKRMWMGQTHVAPGVASADHHHGESETAIYVVSGHPVFVFLEEAGGDREENPDPAEEAVVVIARSTQEAIVVNLPGLYALREPPARD